MTTPILSLRERLAQTSMADKAMLKAVKEAEEKKPEVVPAAEAPKVREDYRPKDLGLVMITDEIVLVITGSLSGELPESLEKALDKLPQSKEIIEEAFTATPGLKEGVEKRYLGLLKKQEKRLGIIYFKEWIADLLTDRPPYELAQELVAFGALIEIPKAKNDEIQEASKAARKHKDEARGSEGHPKNCPTCHQPFVFVRQSFNKNKKETHYYLETERWLSDAFNAHHKALERSQKTLEKHLKDLGITDIDPRKNEDLERSKDALLQIAMGKQLVTMAYLPFEKRLNVDGRRSIFGKYLVQGIEPNEQGVPQMIFLPLEGGESLDECESPMYYATRTLAGMAVFQFELLRSKAKPEFAFKSMQEKSGQSPHIPGFARKILMGTLGVEERKHDQHQPSGQRVAYSGSTTKFAGPTDMELKLRQQGLKPTGEGIDGSGLPGSEDSGAPLGDRTDKSGDRVARPQSEPKPKDGTGKPKPKDKGGAKKSLTLEVREDET